MASTPGESTNVLHGCDFTNAMAYQRALKCGGQTGVLLGSDRILRECGQNVHLGMAVL
jgi:hypothetical protein